MAKMYFAKTVRYQGNRYIPNTVFEVDDHDVADLQAQGGWLIEEKKPVELVREESPVDVLAEEILLEPVLSDDSDQVPDIIEAVEHEDQEELEAIIENPKKPAVRAPKKSKKEA